MVGVNSKDVPTKVLDWGSKYMFTKGIFIKHI